MDIVVCRRTALLPQLKLATKVRQILARREYYEALHCDYLLE
jgi:hypothetical protein